MRGELEWNLGIILQLRYCITVLAITKLIGFLYDQGLESTI